MIGLLIAAIPPVPTPEPPIFSPTATPVSERAVLAAGVNDASARAKALGGLLGVTIVDVTTGATVASNGDANLPMASVEHLPIAVLVYRAIAAGTLSMTRDMHGLLSRMLDDDDDEAANTLLDQLGGSEAANAQLRAMGFRSIFLVPNDAGYATPNALAALFGELAQGKLLDPKETKELLSAFAGIARAPGRLRAGFARNVTLAHVPGTLGGGDDTNIATNDAGVAEVNGRTVVIVAMLQGARGPDAKRDAVIASLAATAAQASTNL